MRFLKQNTATRVTVGPFFDKTDGVTPETALTVTSCKLTLCVDDGGVPTLVLDAAATASGGNNDMVHITNDDAGFYDLELTAAQTNYVGRAMLSITDAATHCPVFHEFMILPANVFDAWMGTDKLDVNAAELGGTSQTGRDIGASVLLGNGAHGGAAATLALKSVAVANSDAGGIAVNIEGTGTGNSHALRLQSTNGKGLAVGSTNNVGMSVDSGASHAVVATGGTDSDGIRAVGNGTGFDINADIHGTVDTATAVTNAVTITSNADVTAIKAKTDNLPAAPAATGDIPSAASVASAVLAQALAAESYAADGGTPTLSQMLWMIWAGLVDYSISGTTLTVKKQDGTAAMTFTLNDATSPTSRTRAT